MKKSKSSARYEKCEVPGCEGNVIVEQAYGKLCPKHSKEMQFLIWALQKLSEKQEGRTKSGIYLPK